MQVTFMQTLRLVLGHPTLRLIAVALLLLGAHNASVYPYQSLIAIERIGLSKASFSVVLVLASAVAVTSSVLFGILGDQYGKRRLIALVTAFASTIGLVLMVFFPGKLSLILTHGLLLPLSSSIYGQLFALLRLAAPGDGQTRVIVQANIRSAMSTSFLLMLVFWTLVFGLGVDVMAVYLSAGAASLAMSLLLYLRWPADGAAHLADARSGLNLAEAMKEIARPLILSRVLMMGAIASAGNLYMILISLVFEASPVRGPSDVALYVGLVAGWEVPAMLILPRLVAHLPRATVLACGAGLYGLHLAVLPWLTDSPFLWVMTLAAGVGGAAIITLPIAYYQDLLHGRPGTAAAMLAVQKLVADISAAGAFYIGTLFGGYQAAALAGVAVSVGGAVLLVVADRRAWLMPALDQRQAA
jgi:hypothetical protein